MKLLLISPPRRHQVWAGVPKMFNDRFAYLFPPLAVMTLSSYLKRETKHTIDVMDCQPTDLGWDDIAGRVRDTQPDVVGVTAPATHCLVDVRKTIEAVRRANPNAFVVLGGPHVNAYPEQSARFPGVDVAMQGDGEVPLARLLDTLEGGGDLASVPNILIKREDGSVFQSDCVPNIEDLDSLPFADREACPPGLYYTPGMKAARTTTMMSSRGCPLRCTFCNVPHSYRKRSPEHVVEEIVECVERYGIEDIHFVDDFFNLTVDRVMQISEEILRRGVKVGWSFKATVRQTSREMIRLAQRADATASTTGSKR
ncbi:MAG: cobalamin-dependent protein [Deltaproteobacteria bacterium]|nr:cobalamin-dependent protein [Deltaproteobacteria bacterium]